MYSNQGGNDTPRLDFGAGRGFDFYVCPQAELGAGLQSGLKSRCWRYGECMMIFAACVEAGDFRSSFSGDESCAVGGALQRFVVHQNRHTIGG